LASRNNDNIGIFDFVLSASESMTPSMTPAGFASASGDVDFQAPSAAI